MGCVLWHPWFFKNGIPSLGVKKPKQRWRTQMGAEENDDSVDDDNDHGEELMENPLIYNKVLS